MTEASLRPWRSGGQRGHLHYGSFPTCCDRCIREKESVSMFALKSRTLALKILDLGIEGMLSALGKLKLYQIGPKYCR